MNCRHCNKVVSDIMTFCPYCGNKTDGEISRIEDDLIVWEQMKALYNTGNHQKLLTYALEGDIFAKFYYLRYIGDLADKKSLSTKTGIAKKLKKHMDEGSVFAKAILGLCRYVYKISFSGVTDDWEEISGKRLIQESAESNEPVAMTIWGKILLQGQGAEKDEFTAYKMIKSAANQRYPPAIYTLGLWHCQGTAGISINEELGNELIEKAAFFGDKGAQNYIRKQDDQWLDTKLGYALSDDELKSALALMSDEISSEKVLIPIALREKYERCQGKEDYIDLYKLLRDEYSEDESTKELFDSLQLFIINITGYSLDKMSIEEAQAFDDMMARVSNVVERYELPQHYLHLKDDIKTLEIDISDKDMPYVIQSISKGLREKCEKDVEKYIEYSKAKEDAKYPEFGCGLVFCIIIAIIGVMIFPIISWIAGGFALLSILAKTSSLSRFKKISITNKESYLLINALIGYGYSVLTSSDCDPKYSYGKFDENELYKNNVSSVYSKNIARMLSKNISTETKIK